MQSIAKKGDKKKVRKTRVKKYESQGRRSEIPHQENPNQGLSQYKKQEIF